jgi:hypothetical protein
MSGALPTSVERLFWDIDPGALDLARHADYVMERVMTRGPWDAMKWLRHTYSREELAGFLARKARLLAPRDVAYWSLVSGAAIPSTPGGARPPWAGP